MPNQIENIRQLIAKNDLKKVFEELLQKTLTQSSRDEVIMLKSNFEDNEKKVRTGIISNQDSIIESNKVKNSLLGLIKNLEFTSSEKKDSPPSNVGFFDPIQLQLLIKSKKSSNNFYKIIGFTSLLMGILIVLVGFYNQEGLIKGAGVFTSAMSSFSFNEFIKRREDISFLVQILNYLQSNKDKKTKEVYLNKLETIYLKKLESAILS